MPAAPILVSRMVQDLRRFITYDTVTWKSNEAFARYVGALLSRAGFRVSYQRECRAAGMFVNVVAMKGPRRGRPLLLCAHLDTVPPGDARRWTRTGGKPWRAKVSRREVIGLGSADDKGPLAAILEAARRAPARLERPLLVLGTFGEEAGMGGAKLFTRSWRGDKPVAAFVAEPTDLTLTYRHKGIGVLEIELETWISAPSSRAKPMHFRGKQGHSSLPALGVNAIDKAVVRLSHDLDALVTRLHGGYAANLIPADAELELSSRSGPKRPAFRADWIVACRDITRMSVSRRTALDRTFKPPRLTSNLGIARTNGKKLTLTFDFRLLPGQAIDPIFTEIKTRVAKALRGEPVRATVRLERANPALDGSRDDAFVRYAGKALRACGLPATLRAKAGCTEAGFYGRWGVPSVVFGPGRAARNIHAPNERVQIAQMKAAVAVYDRLIECACERGESLDSGSGSRPEQGAAMRRRVEGRRPCS